MRVVIARVLPDDAGVWRKLLLRVGSDGLLIARAPHCDRLGMDRLDAASQLCTLVFTCDLPLLRRFITAGVPVDAGDYDDRTALHISACESNLAVVRSHDSSCRDWCPFGNRLWWLQPSTRTDRTSVFGRCLMGQGNVCSRLHKQSRYNMQGVQSAVNQLCGL